MWKTILFLLLFMASVANAQHLPQTDGDSKQYGVTIDFGKAYLSGICIMMMENNVIKASIVNEFGISAVDFTYDTTKDKLCIVNVMQQLNKWYIKRTLKHDLRYLIEGMYDGQLSYINNKRNITYTLSPLQDNGSDK